LSLARQYHPDVNSSAEAKRVFSEINEAHQTLGDEKTRQIYDSTGMSANEQQNEEQAFKDFNPFSFFGGGGNTKWKTPD
jgi:DnaJ-class molecular chaperone